MAYTVGEAANIIGISASAVRFYEKEGLLPPARRTESGRRMFSKSDLEWLKIIECLKKTDMPLKEIKRYIQLAAEGDGTIDERLQLFITRRAEVCARIEELENTLSVIDYKIWYYERAQERGTLSGMENIPADEVPEELRSAAQSIKIR